MWRIPSHQSWITRNHTPRPPLRFQSPSNKIWLAPLDETLVRAALRSRAQPSRTAQPFTVSIYDYQVRTRGMPDAHARPARSSQTPGTGPPSLVYGCHARRPFRYTARAYNGFMCLNVIRAFQPFRLADDFRRGVRQYNLVASLLVRKNPAARASQSRHLHSVAARRKRRTTPHAPSIGTVPPAHDD